MRIKREITIFSILEFRDIEKHLEKRAAEGWMLKKVGTFLWNYEETTPQKVHFSIVFFPKTTALEPEPSDNLLMMREYCEKTGWKLVAENGQMQIFCNEEEKPLPIETEACIQVENIHQTAKKNLTFVHWILLINAFMQLGLQAMQFIFDPLNWLGLGYHFYLGLVWIALGIGSATELIQYYTWYHKAKRIAAEEEELYLPKSHTIFRGIYLGIAFVSLILSILSIAEFTSSKYGVLVIVYAIMAIGVPLCVSRLLKERKVSAKKNRIAIVILAVIVSVGMTAYTFVSIIKDFDNFFQKEKAVSLQISDFIEVEDEDFRESFRMSNSPFISYVEGYQAAKWEEGAEEIMMIDYTILVIKAPFCYDFCKNELLKEYSYLSDDVLIEKSGYKKIDAAKWGAEEVYCNYFDDEPSNKFVVCYEDRMIKIDFSWDVTDSDMEKVSELILKK